MKKIILDCDPGHDDALAILLALSSPELKVEAITTVAGNQTLPKTSLNALKVLTAAGRTDIPVAAGMSRPLVRDLVVAPHVHGETGLDGTDLPEPAFKLDKRHAVDLIIEKVLNSPEKITVIPVGPLSNIGMALLKEPRVAENIERIVLMGGSIAEGNITPSAEFNIYVDPEAAKLVFESGIPITMVGLDVTHKALITYNDFQTIRAIGTPLAIMVAELLDFYAKFHDEVYGFGGVPLHDACAVAEVIKPGIITTKPMYVAVETQGALTAGRTVCDIWGVTGKPANVDVGIDIDVQAFKEMLFAALKSYTNQGLWGDDIVS
ncbi:nucleoside hydrolase [Zhaonella formicivorans]|uniref:nucleoside hydrolase n=1 Tax=Zhaonella formicivorans TaxID=2528593 RepID=UPI0010D197CA|nr:nucleoside hydrolase [Zhaonella formicivorans]